jgi:hypothetical protein
MKKYLLETGLFSSFARVDLLWKNSLWASFVDIGW